jgi:hypothetical protein
VEILEPKSLAAGRGNLRTYIHMYRCRFKYLG